MKLAFLHCWIFPGGALNVLKDWIVEEKIKHHNSKIKIFTMVSDSKTLDIQNSEYKIVTALPSRLNNFFIYCTQKNIPILSSLFDYRNLIVFAPLLMRILSSKIKKYKAEHINISSFAVAKNINIPLLDKVNSGERESALGYKGGVRGGFVPTTLYLHSPMQYIRSHYDEYSEKLTGRKGKIFKWITPRLRKRDKKFTQFDEVYANSNYTAQLAEEIYGIKAKVKYPSLKKTLAIVDLEPNSYYLYTGRLVKFVKEVDKIIYLFNQTKDPLIIMGNGPDELELKSIAGSNIIFVDWIRDEREKFSIIKKAKGFINITKESFGISTLEALLCGVPVFGYNDGATPELVDQDSGILVDEKDQGTLVTAFETFKTKTRDRQKISDNIRKKLNN